MVHDSLSLCASSMWVSRSSVDAKYLWQHWHLCTRLPSGPGQLSKHIAITFEKNMSELDELPWSNLWRYRYSFNEKRLSQPAIEHLNGCFSSWILLFFTLLPPARSFSFSLAMSSSSHATGFLLMRPVWWATLWDSNVFKVRKNLSQILHVSLSLCRSILCAALNSVVGKYKEHKSHLCTKLKSGPEWNDIFIKRLERIMDSNVKIWIPWTLRCFFKRISTKYFLLQYSQANLLSEAMIRRFLLTLVVRVSSSIDSSLLISASSGSLCSIKKGN